MGKIEEFSNKANPVIGKISNSAFVKTLMGGMMAAFPAMMAGSFATILNTLPFTAYQNLLAATHLNTVFAAIIRCTTDLVALYIVFGIAYAYTKRKNQDAMTSGLIALASFVVITPFLETVAENGRSSFSIPTQWLGGSGMTCAIILGFISAIIFTFIKEKGWTIKLPSSVPPVISSSFEGIIPSVIIIPFFGLISMIFSLTPFGSLHQAVYTLLQAPLSGLSTNIWAVVIIIIATQVVWLLGIHGPMVIIPIVASVWYMSDLANLTAYNAGEALPNMFGLATYMVYSSGGGALGLAISMLFAKSKRYKALGKLSIVPALFGITEPLIFGTPIVMNFKIAIPHIVLPAASILLGYFLTVIGVLPPLIGVRTPAGTPVLVMGLMQGGWKVMVFQGILIVIWTLGYFPFFKSLDKEALKLEQEEPETV